MEISDTLKASLSPAVLLFLYLLSLRDDLSNENIQLIALIMKNCFPAQEVRTRIGGASLEEYGEIARAWKNAEGRSLDLETGRGSGPRNERALRQDSASFFLDRYFSDEALRGNACFGAFPGLDALRRRLCLRTRACGSRERRKPRHPVPLRVHSRPRSRQVAGRPSTGASSREAIPRVRGGIASAAEARCRGQQRRADEATGGPRRRGSRTAARRQPHSCPGGAGKAGSGWRFHFLAAGCAPRRWWPSPFSWCPQAGDLEGLHPFLPRERMFPRCQRFSRRHRRPSRHPRRRPLRLPLGTTTYIVRSGDSLWKIFASTSPCGRRPSRVD